MNKEEVKNGAQEYNSFEHAGKKTNFLCKIGCSFVKEKGLYNSYFGKYATRSMFHLR